MILQIFCEITQGLMGNLVHMKSILGLVVAPHMVAIFRADFRTLAIHLRVQYMKQKKVATAQQEFIMFILPVAVVAQEET